MNMNDRQYPEKRLIVFDMDNTLLEGRFIDTVCEFLGLSDPLIYIRKTVNDPTMRTDRIAALLKGVDLEILLAAARGIPIVSDAASVIASLKAWGCITGIISDSYDCVTEWVRRELDMDFALSNLLETDGKAATGRVRIPSCFNRGTNPPCAHEICKSHAIQSVSQLYGIPQRQTIAVGDSENDICMVRYAGIGIAFCSENSQLKAVADHVITVRSFQELLEITVKDIERTN